MESEKKVEKHLVDRVKKMGGKAYKFVSPGNAGVPDRIVVLPELPIWFVELKSSTGSCTKQQKARIRELALLGAHVTVLGSVKDVDAFLDCCDNKYESQTMRLYQAIQYDLLTGNNEKDKRIIGTDIDISGIEIKKAEV